MIQEQRPDQDDYRRTETIAEREAREQRDVQRGFREPRAEYEYETEEYRGAEAREPRQRREPYTYRETLHEPHGEPDTRVQTVFSTSGINIVAGLWLVLAPFALGYAAIEAALWNSIIIGIAVAVMAIIRVTRPTEHEGVSWVNFVLGIWLIVSPFVLGLMNIEALVWNNIIVGIVVLALAATSAMATRRMHDEEHAARTRRRWT